MIGGYTPRLFYFNRAAPGANTDIIATTITNIVTGALTTTNYYSPNVDCCIIVSVALSTASVFNMTESDGTNSFTNGINSSVSLGLGDLYSWSLIPVKAGYQYNFQVETNSIIRRLFIVQLEGGTAS